jgi:hypothetical protein
MNEDCLVCGTPGCGSSLCRAIVWWGERCAASYRDIASMRALFRQTDMLTLPELDPRNELALAVVLASSGVEPGDLRRAFNEVGRHLWAAPEWER